MLMYKGTKMKKRKFVVLGAGTAGWITAHFVRRFFPDDDVTIVYSEKQGIIGVGEAATPHLTDFLKTIGIDFPHFLKSVGSTIKHGISFENWNGDGKKYMHPFTERLVDFSVEGVFANACWDYYNKFLINKNLPFDDYLYQCKLAYNNKVDVQNTNFSIHFDAIKFAEYLEWFGSQKNIKKVVGEYASVDQSENGNIKKINLEDGRSIEVDFIFDCSGFAKLLIEKVYKEKWISYKHHLPMNKAIAFWIDKDEDFIPSYTAAIAMKYGWIWKIPLQHRYGCGYVYDSTYINETQAIQEAEELFQRKLTVRKSIDIDAGRMQNVWVKNCIAIGLSANFLEPLESTSIWLELSTLQHLADFINEIDDQSENSIKLFNEIVANEVDEKMSFVYLHYMTKRNDSEFWREFREKHPMPDRLKKIWPYIKENNLRYYQIYDSMAPAAFPLMSYLWVCQGLELFESPGNLSGYEKINPSPEIYRAIINSYLENAPDQKTFLSSL